VASCRSPVIEHTSGDMSDPASCAVLGCRTSRLAWTAWQMCIERTRWKTVAVDAVHEAIARRLNRVQAQRSAFRAWLCKCQACRMQLDLAVLHASRARLFQVCSPVDAAPSYETTAPEVGHKWCLWLSKQVTWCWRQHSSAMALADCAVLTQHAITRVTNSRKRVLNNWRAAAEQTSIERAAALRQQHMWDRVSSWLSVDTKGVLTMSAASSSYHSVR